MMRKVLVFLGLMAVSFPQLVAEETYYPKETLKERQDLVKKYERDGGRRINQVKMLLTDDAGDESRAMAINFLVGRPPGEGLDEYRTPDVKAVPQLLYALQNDPSWKVRKTAAEYVIEVSNQGGIPEALKKSLQDRDDRVKMTTARSLLELNPMDTDAIDLLLALSAGSEKPDIKFEAVASLPDSYAYKREYQLKILLEDSSMQRRMRIAESLYKKMPRDAVIRKIYIVTSLLFIKIIPGTPPEDINPFDSTKVVRALDETISGDPEYFRGNRFIINELKEIIKIRKESSSKYSKDGLTGIENILRKSETFK